MKICIIFRTYINQFKKSHQGHAIVKFCSLLICISLTFFANHSEYFEACTSPKIIISRDVCFDLYKIYENTTFTIFVVILKEECCPRTKSSKVKLPERK